MSDELPKALRELAERIGAKHPKLAAGARLAAFLSDDAARDRVVAELESRGAELTQRAVDAALNGRR